jgi:uncharacterized membrane protein YedE/YeeE
MTRMLAALGAGLLFGIGLALSRMTDPNVVLGFLDPFGAFDPTLLFVMAGAVATTLVAFRLVLRRGRPLLDAAFHVPTARAIDAPLLLGAAIFGVGWGIAGYCPGPVLASAARGIDTALVFVPAMIAGSLLQGFVSARASQPSALPSALSPQKKRREATLPPE